MTALPVEILRSIRYRKERGLPMPDALKTRALKAMDSMVPIRAEYHDEITAALLDYFEGRSITASRNDFKKAISNAFNDAFDLGWVLGGGELPTDSDANDWLNARKESEFGFAAALFEQAKELKKEPDFDRLPWVSERADGYSRTLDAVFNMGKMMSAKNKMLTFDGEDGDANHICQSINGTCVKLKGKRHRASWWLAHDLIPYPGNSNFDCGGWRCQHYLRDDEGNRFTL